MPTLEVTAEFEAAKEALAIATRRYNQAWAIFNQQCIEEWSRENNLRIGDKITITDDFMHLLRVDRRWPDYDMRDLSPGMVIEISGISPDTDTLSVQFKIGGGGSGTGGVPASFIKAMRELYLAVNK